MFKPISIKSNDNKEIISRLKSADFRGCEYSFSCNYMWRNYFDIRYTLFGKFYLVRNETGYLFPAGSRDAADAEIIEAVDFMLGDSKKLGKAFSFSSMDNYGKERLEKIYGNKISFSSNRDTFDYIYKAENLITLYGKKYHSKRNFIKRFKDNYNWHYEPITPENISACTQINRLWLENRLDFTDNVEDERFEIAALEDGLCNFEALNFIGGIIFVEEKPVAYTFGERQNSDTFTIHAEKALTDYIGVFPTIMSEFAQRELKEFFYVNREEDVGILNLRKSKESYNPEFLLEKFSAEFV